MQYKLIVTFGIGLMSYIFGGWDMLLKTLVCLTIIDYLTGVIAGIIEQRISSQVGFKGILKKVSIFLIVALSNLLDTGLGTDLLRTVTISFYIANEGWSILENATKIGIPVPEKLKMVLQQYKKEGDEDV